MLLAPVMAILAMGHRKYSHTKYITILRLMLQKRRLQHVQRRFRFQVSPLFYKTCSYEMLLQCWFNVRSLLKHHQINPPLVSCCIDPNIFCNGNIIIYNTGQRIVHSEMTAPDWLLTIKGLKYFHLKQETKVFFI